MAKQDALGDVIKRNSLGYLKKDNIADMIESGEAPSVTVKKKKYLVDHKTVWDKERNRALITAEGVEGGRRVIETTDKRTQEKLEELGYKPNQENKLMHSPGQARNPGIKSADQVQSENERLMHS